MIPKKKGFQQIYVLIHFKIYLTPSAGLLFHLVLLFYITPPLFRTVRPPPLPKIKRRNEWKLRFDDLCSTARSIDISTLSSILQHRIFNLLSDSFPRLIDCSDRECFRNSEGTHNSQT